MIASPGAILSRASRQYQPSFDDRQLIFYIVDGEAIFEGGDLKQEVREGDGIIVPPGTTHVLNNEANTTPLEFLILEETVADAEGAPREDVLIRNYPENPPESGALDPSRPPHFRSRMMDLRSCTPS